MKYVRIAVVDSSDGGACKLAGGAQSTRNLVVASGETFDVEAAACESRVVARNVVFNIFTRTICKTATRIQF